MAHLLDFGRNPINVVDAVCGISPPPGMPLTRGPEDVAHYLRTQGLFWIATSESTWYPGGETREPEDLRRYSEGYEYTVWKSQIYSYYLLFSCLKALETKYDTTRVENGLVLIDLSRPRASELSRAAMIHGTYKFIPLCSFQRPGALVGPGT